MSFNEQMDEPITESMFAQEPDNENLMLFTAIDAPKQPKQIKREIKAEKKKLQEIKLDGPFVTRRHSRRISDNKL